MNKMYFLIILNFEGSTISYLYYCTCVQIFDRENKVPVLSPHDVAVLDSEAAELAWVKIFVVLRMGMTTYEITDIYCLLGVIVECQANAQVAHLLRIDDDDSIHILSSGKDKQYF